MTDHTAFKPMLAKAGNLDKVTYPLAVQDKLDGIRASVVNGRLVSRKLKLIPNQEIQNALARPELEGLDGELIVGSPTAPGCMQTTSSFVMAPNKTGAPWAFHAFDMWNHPGDFLARHTVAASIVREWRGPGDLVIVPFKMAKDAGELDSIEAAALAEGHEGVIARVPDSLYKFGRSGVTGPLLKVKRFLDFEAKVVGTYEEMHNANEAKRDALGRTERSTRKAGKVGKGRLGGLELVAINGPCEGVAFRCGTGFNAAQRESLWAVRNELSGRTAKIKSFPVGVKVAPRFPVFLDWRNMEIDG